MSFRVHDNEILSQGILGVAAFGVGGKGDQEMRWALELPMMANFTKDGDCESAWFQCRRASPAQETLVEHCKALLFAQELVMHVAKECGDNKALAARFGDMAAYLNDPVIDTFGMSQHDLSVHLVCQELVRGSRHKEISCSESL